LRIPSAFARFLCAFFSCGQVRVCWERSDEMMFAGLIPMRNSFLFYRCYHTTLINLEFVSRRAFARPYDILGSFCNPPARASRNSSDGFRFLRTHCQLRFARVRVIPLLSICLSRRILLDRSEPDDTPASPPSTAASGLKLSSSATSRPSSSVLEKFDVLVLSTGSLSSF